MMDFIPLTLSYNLFIAFPPFSPPLSHFLFLSSSFFLLVSLIFFSCSLAHLAGAASSDEELVPAVRVPAGGDAKGH
jgi:hypothetical protein